MGITGILEFGVESIDDEIIKESDSGITVAFGGLFVP
jgi:hypothetical protein